MQRLVSRLKTRKGFTLVELAVVIVIIGVLAAFGVPKFLASVEKSKASEAFNYWSAVASAQERFLAQNGTYSENDSSAAKELQLDIALPKLQYFTLDTGKLTVGSGNLSTNATPTWSGILTRTGTSSSYGEYTVKWNQDGFDTTSSISQEISPVAGYAHKTP